MQLETAEINFQSLLMIRITELLGNNSLPLHAWNTESTGLYQPWLAPLHIISIVRRLYVYMFWSTYILGHLTNALIQFINDDGQSWDKWLESLSFASLRSPKGVYRVIVKRVNQQKDRKDAYERKASHFIGKERKVISSIERSQDNSQRSAGLHRQQTITRAQHDRACNSTP